MENLIIYLLKASALLGIFYLSYVVLLKKETSFQLNRKFMIAGIFTSMVLPLIYFTRKIYITTTPSTYDYLPVGPQNYTTPVETPIDWWLVSGIIYFIVTGIFVFRLCIQLGSVFKVILSNNSQRHFGMNYLEVSGDQLPFSFFNYIVFNPQKHSRKDLDLILEHEKVHVRQFHSADIILVNLLSCILWFNPFTWLYKRSLEQNLEFIADRETVNKKAEIKEYQHALVKVSIANLKPALTNHFYQSFIKKRILMLNKQSSTNSPAWKLSLIAPLLLAFMLLFNVKTEAKVKNTNSQITVQNPIVENGKALTINSKVPKKRLEKLQNFFKDEGIVLKFTDIEYNDETIVNISSTMTNPVKGITKTYNQGNSKGIKPLKIYLNDDGTMGYETLKEKEKAPIEQQNQFQDLGEKPLYIINGKPVKADDLKNKYIKYNGTVDVRTGVAATALYGFSAKDGSVNISKAEILNNFTDDASFKENAAFSQKYIMVDSEGKPFEMKLETKINSSESNVNDINVSGIKFSTDEPEEIKETLSAEKIIGFQEHTEKTKTTSGQSKKNEAFFVQLKTLYVVDGKVQDSEFIKDAIDPKNISKVNVLKGTAATSKYGKKAADGVVEIFTKEYEGDTSSSEKTDLYVLDKNQTDSSIENLKKMIKSQSDIDTEFSDVKRNSEGIITSISIKVKTAAGQSASASFQNDEGIPLIMIGMNEENRLIVSSNYKPKD